MKKAIVCFSGGHSSALAAYGAVEKYGKNNVVLLNHDISGEVEHPDIKRFKQEVADRLGVPLAYANAPNFEAMTPLAVARKKKSFGVGSVKFCTSVLKTEPFHRWLRCNYPATAQKPCHEIVLVYGFDKHEQQRIERRKARLSSMGYETEYPVANGDVSISRIEDIGIQRPEVYRTYKHANCAGCLKAGKQHWYTVYRLRPDIWQEAKETELLIGYSIINGSFLHELEPEFELMKAVGIAPSDKQQQQTFWADARKRSRAALSLTR